MEYIRNYLYNIFADIKTDRMMWLTVLSLIPVIAAASYYFGQRAMLVISLAVLVSFAAQAILNFMKKDPLYRDFGMVAVISSLFALALPVTISIWMVIIGSLIAFAVAKFFSRIDFFHPSSVALAFLFISFPIWKDDYISRMYAGGFSSIYSQNLFSTLFFSNLSDSIGSVSVIAILVSLALLSMFKAISWKAPLFAMASMFLLAFILKQPWGVHILAGNFLLGMLFIQKGDKYHGILYAIFTFLLRPFIAPAAPFFAVLLLNASATFIK